MTKNHLDIDLSPSTKHLIILFISALVVYLFWVASYLKIDYYDSFLILLNAKCIATSSINGYSGVRPIILPIVLSPFAALEKWTGIPRIAFMTSHMIMIIFFGIFLFVLYRLYRFHLSKMTALLGVFFLSLNRALIHSAPYCKEDVFAIFLMTTAMYFYLKAEKNGVKWQYLISGLFISLAIGARFNYPMIFPILVAYEFLSRKTYLTLSPQKLFFDGKNSKWKVFCLFIFPILVFILIVSLHYKGLQISSFSGAFYKYLTEPVAYMMSLVQESHQLTPIYGLIFLGKSTSWPFLVLGIVGMIAALSKRLPGSLFYFLWFSAFFIFHTFMVLQKEARFFIALYPPLYFFIVTGFGEVWDALKRIGEEKFKRFLKIAQIVFLVMILFVPMKDTLGECIQYRDPIYRVDFPRELGIHVANLAGPHKIYWTGGFYTVYPKNYIFHPEDVTYYVYHLYMSAIMLNSDKAVNTLDHAKFIIPPDPNDPIFIGPNAQAVLEDGDVLIINLEKEGYETKRIPKEGIHPLYVERARKLFFDRVENTANSQRFQSSQFPDIAVEAKTTPEGFALDISGVLKGRYEIYVELEDPAVTIPLTILDSTDGKLRFLNSEYQKPLPIRKVILLFFDSVKTFTNPR